MQIRQGGGGTAARTVFIDASAVNTTFIFGNNDR